MNKKQAKRVLGRIGDQGYSELTVEQQDKYAEVYARERNKGVNIDDAMLKAYESTPFVPVDTTITGISKEIAGKNKKIVTLQGHVMCEKCGEVFSTGDKVLEFNGKLYCPKDGSFLGRK